jgi:hypothetical protein
MGGFKWLKVKIRENHKKRKKPKAVSKKKGN